MNLDEYGLPVGRKEDAGDSLHRACMWLLGEVWFRNIAPAAALNLLKYQHTNGSWSRHPSEGWWADGDRLSRDQATPLVIALSECYPKYILWDFFIQHFKRGFFFFNTRKNGATLNNHGTDKYYGHPKDGQYDYAWKLPDPPGAEFFAIYIRALRIWWLYPMLLILDLETLIGSVIWKFKTGQTDVLNHMIVCEYATRVYKTPLSILAKRLNSKDQFNANLEYYFNRVGLIEMAKLWYIN